MTGPAEIAPRETEKNRPFWSVMVPTFEPDPLFLAETLESVLCQDPGEEIMQIQLVDDCSEGFDPAEFLQGRLAGRVRWLRQPKRVGIACNWNMCVRSALGEWVHILHQDDLVRPEFYSRFEEAIRNEDKYGAVVGQTEFIDDRGRVRATAFPGDLSGGILEDWVEHVFVLLRIQAAAIAVRREAYEHLGGFDESFEYAMDWDMWMRLAISYPIYYEPRARACWRDHSGSTTRRLMHSGQNMREIERCIERGEQLMPAEIASEAGRRARIVYTQIAVDNAIKIIRRSGDLTSSVRQFAAARRLTSSSEIARYVWRRLTGTAQDPSE